jgi:hypothetical protein
MQVVSSPLDGWITTSRCQRQAARRWLGLAMPMQGDCATHAEHRRTSGRDGMRCAARRSKHAGPARRERPAALQRSSRARRMAVRHDWPNDGQQLAKAGRATKCDDMGFGVMERKQFSFFSPATTSSHMVAILGAGQGGVCRWLGARRDAGRSLPSMRVMRRRGSPGKGRVGPDCRAGRHGRQSQDGARAAATVSWLAVAATSWHEGRGSLGRRGWREGRGGGETHLQEPWPGATRRKDWNRYGCGQGKGIAVEIEGGVEEIMHGARL